MSDRTVFVVNDTSVSGHPGCVTVMSVIRDNIEMRGLSVGGTWPLGVEPQLGLALHSALRSAAAVIVNGEGTIHNTAIRPGARRLLHTVGRVRSLTSAPLFLINATIENLRQKDFTVLRHFDRIFVRDSLTRRYLEANNIEATITPDLCFSAGYRRLPKGGDIVVTDSTMSPATKLLQQWGRLLNARYVPMQISRLPSMVRWTVSRRSHEAAAIRYFGIIAGATAVMTGRFHAAVFSLLSETPFLAVGSNTSKIQSLLGDVFGHDNRVINQERLRSSAVRVPEFSDEERRQIMSYRALAHRQAQSMFDHIAQAAALWSSR